VTFGLGNCILRTISGPKLEKETGEQTIFHDEKLHNLYLSPYTIGRSNKTG
jgi:hypothetical protein